MIKFRKTNILSVGLAVVILLGNATIATAQKSKSAKGKKTEKVAAPKKSSETERLKAEMNEIKNSEAYLYGEGMGGDSETAINNAIGDLREYLDIYYGEANMENIPYENVEPIVKIKDVQDGARYSAVVYLEIAELKRLAGGGEASSAATTAVAAKPKEKENPIPSISSMNTWIEIKTLIKKAKTDGTLQEHGVEPSLEEVPEDAWVVVLDEKGGMRRVYSPLKSGKREMLADVKTEFPSVHYLWYK